jgi:hypothetical protein
MSYRLAHPRRVRATRLTALGLACPR